MFFLTSSAISPQEAIAPKQIRAANTIRSEGLSANNCYYGMSGTTCYEYLISYLADLGKRFLDAIAQTAQNAKTPAWDSRGVSERRASQIIFIWERASSDFGNCRGVINQIVPMLRSLSIVYPGFFGQTEQSVLVSEKSFSVQAIALKLNQLIEQQRLTDCMVMLEEYDIVGDEAVLILAHLQNLGGVA
ncbi:MAG: hypothetical protein KME46_33640 [Brasilonema angustatum HA4187-MV1]|jgi:hypothetical protein|nr:hypothetical protein [Brasilonema angustatum HA4187-MV1]